MADPKTATHTPRLSASAAERAAVSTSVALLEKYDRLEKAARRLLGCALDEDPKAVGDAMNELTLALAGVHRARAALKRAGLEP